MLTTFKFQHSKKIKLFLKMDLPLCPLLYSAL
jgi:hypothetical protein